MIRFLFISSSVIGFLAYGIYKLTDATASTSIASFQPLASDKSSSPTEPDLATIKKIVDRASTLQNAVAGAASVVATACVVVRQSVCGAVASGISGGTWLGSAVASQASLDLSDEDYLKIALADGQHIDISKFPASTQVIVRTLIRANRIATIITSTANEALVAAETGNVEFYRKKLGTLHQYEDQLTNISNELTSEISAYINNITSQEKFSSAMAGLQSEASAITYQLRATTEGLKAQALFSCLRTSDGAITGYIQKEFCHTMNFFIK